MTAAWCCDCVRFRRHDCKHIRLILQQLGVEEQPGSWEQVGVWVYMCVFLRVRCKDKVLQTC